MIGRICFVLAFVAFLGQATGAFLLVAEGQYRQSCPDERLGDQCIPACLCYTCGVHHRPLHVFEGIVLPEPHTLHQMFSQPVAARTSPRPTKIFHVPKPPLM
jgi:hypothetical protein